MLDHVFEDGLGEDISEIEEAVEQVGSMNSRKVSVTGILFTFSELYKCSL